MKGLLVALCLMGCNTPQTIPVGQYDAGTERICHPDSSRFIPWHVEGNGVVIYGEIKLDCWGDIFMYAITVDSVTIR